jgi:hypothetical protein
MKRISISIRLIMLCVFLSVSYYAKSQQQIAEFLKGNVKDAETLATAYMEPFGKMFGTSLNGGWYQAARPHKLLGFNVTFVTSVATVPTSAKTFDVSKLNLEELVLADPSNNISQTISGKNTLGPRVVYKDDPSGTLGFDLPKGANLPFTFMPMIQAGIGLPFHTELTVRFLPSINVPKVGSVNLWGVGVKNEFKEFIPGLKLVPIDLSIMLGYTKFASEFEISYKPAPADMPTGYTAANFNDQKLALDANGFTARLLVGKSLPFLSAYVGLGYSTAKTDFGLKGTYPIGMAPVYSGVEVDPFMMKYSHNGFSGNIGFRVRLGVIAFNVDYTLGEYALYSGGIGISFR